MKSLFFSRWAAALVPLLVMFAPIGCGEQRQPGTPEVRDAPPPDAPGGAPSEGETAAVSGRQLYERFCLSCHGRAGQGIEGSGPSLLREKWQEAELREVILQGRGKMPAFGNRLSDEQLAAVIEYVQGLPSEQQPLAPAAPR